MPLLTGEGNQQQAEQTEVWIGRPLSEDQGNRPHFAETLFARAVGMNRKPIEKMKEALIAA